VPRPAAAAPALSGFAQRPLDLPAPAQTRSFAVADFRYGDLAGADFPVLVWRRDLVKIRSRARHCCDMPIRRGDIELRTALKGYLWPARGISCTADDIIIVNGSQQGLDLCARIFVEPGDPFLMEDPGYPLARHAFVATARSARLCHARAPVPAWRSAMPRAEANVPVRATSSRSTLAGKPSFGARP
jgi:GntR family transcriptional regulator/MocR family aminotransferase